MVHIRVPNVDFGTGFADVLTNAGMYWWRLIVARPPLKKRGNHGNAKRGDRGVNVKLLGDGSFGREKRCK